MVSNNFWIVSDEEKPLVVSLNKKSDREERTNRGFAIMDLDDYFKLFTNEEIALIKKYLSFDPKQTGIKLPYLGYEPPIDLMEVSDQVYLENGKERKLQPQYLPKRVYKAYLSLVSAMSKDIGKKVLIEWGYRSPACQVHNFFKYLEYHKFDFGQTISRVCFPDYSEHVCVKRQAVDFITTEGIDDGFDKTKEYMWLRENAASFRFFESYPKGNKVGMMYEPWHWHYEEPDLR